DVEYAPIFVICVSTSALSVLKVSTALLDCPFNQFNWGRRVLVTSNRDNYPFPVQAIPVSEVNRLCVLPLGEYYQLVALSIARCFARVDNSTSTHFSLPPAETAAARAANSASLTIGVAPYLPAR